VIVAGLFISLTVFERATSSLIKPTYVEEFGSRVSPNQKLVAVVSDLSFRILPLEDEKREVTIREVNKKSRWSGELIVSLIGGPFVDLYWLSDKKLRICWSDLEDYPVEILINRPNSKKLSVEIDLVHDTDARAVAESTYISPGKDFTVGTLVRTSMIPEGHVTNVLVVPGESERLRPNSSTALLSVYGKHALQVNWVSKDEVEIACSSCSSTDIVFIKEDFPELSVSYSIGQSDGSLADSRSAAEI